MQNSFTLQNIMSLPTKKYDFNGKVVLITGSSSGIGAAIAIKLAEYGAKLTITGRNRENLTKVADKIKAVSDGHVPLQLIGDLLDPATGTMLVNETITHYKQLNVLINNAGGASSHGDLLNGGKDLLTDYDSVFKLNVRAPIQLIQLAMPYLIKSQGNILNTVSVDGLTPSQLVYSSSKAALIMVTKTCAMDLGPKKVRVNAIAPGPVNTAFGRSYGEPNVYKDHAEDFKKGTVLHRIAEPEEIANLACFLVSDLAENVTGSIMVDDAGVMVQKR